jgi:hypothetical protein
MTYTVPSDIYQAVHPYASASGIPDSIWEDVAYTESSFNPNAHNPSGAYGLFQLLTPGGQGDLAIQQGHSINDLYNPGINAKYAMPSIEKAWIEEQSTFDGSNIEWWKKFAAESGHPGGSPNDPATVQEARLLMANYQGDPHMREQFSNPAANAVNQVGSGTPFGLDPQSILTLVGIFLFGIVIVVIGFFILKG